MVTTLVTGASGFVGAHLCRALSEAGHTVRALHRASSRLDMLYGLPVESALGDVTDPDSLRAAAHGCQWIFHTAAVSDYWRGSTARLYAVNVGGTRHVAQIAREVGAARLILTSSAAAVGMRDDGRPADESLPFNLPPKRFPYGHSKWQAEGEALAVAEALEVVILNPAVIFGPGDLNHISGSMIIEAARGLVPPLYPVGALTAIDVRDVAHAHLMAAERGTPGARYLLGAEDWTYRALWTQIAGMVGARAPRLPLPAALAGPLSAAVGLLSRLGVRLPVNADQVWLSARDLRFDSGKARAAFGPPQISVAQSLQDTYAWYQARGEA